jgi:DNA-binding transcriptional LysR family regulator
MIGGSLYEMSVFARVVANGSLSAAARDLGVSTAVVSRRLAALESRLGVRLVNRTTRRLSLTDEGASYHEACARILSEVEDADAAAAARRVEPQGVLKVALPASFGHKHIAPLVPPFAARYPKIQLVLSLSDRIVNMVEDVRINLETLTEQKAIVDHVVESLAKLSTLVQEGQTTLRALHAERELAERIERGIRQLRAKSTPEEGKRSAASA